MDLTDALDQIGAVRRGLTSLDHHGKPARALTAEQTYDAPPRTSGTPSPTPSGCRAGSCRSRATSASAVATSSSATPAAPSSGATRRGRWRSPGSTATWSAGSRSTWRDGGATTLVLRHIAPRRALGPLRPRRGRHRLGPVDARARPPPRHRREQRPGGLRGLVDGGGGRRSCAAATTAGTTPTSPTARTRRRAAAGRPDPRLLHRPGGAGLRCTPSTSSATRCGAGSSSCSPAAS